ncbi:MAG: hypothetical protein K0U72_12580 [Gammaproteobacteria bacterium]|nr:hypothetical protein [Gammaproteobacteria bacterium]
MKKSPLPLLFLFAQPALAVDDALSQCRQISETLERVACYDSFVDARHTTESGNSTESSKPSAPDAQSLFGTPDAEAKRIVSASLEIEQIEQIEATITDVRKSRTRKLTVTLDNGQVWRQLDSQPMRLESGEAVVVRKASLGSYQMEKKSGGRRIRVKRAN